MNAVGKGNGAGDSRKDGAVNGKTGDGCIFFALDRIEVRGGKAVARSRVIDKAGARRQRPALLLQVPGVRVQRSEQIIRREECTA